MTYFDVPDTEHTYCTYFGVLDTNISINANDATVLQYSIYIFNCGLSWLLKKNPIFWGIKTQEFPSWCTVYQDYRDPPALISKESAAVCPHPWPCAV